MKGETSNNHISTSRLGFGKIFSDPCNTPLVLHNPRVSSKSVYRENPMDFGHPPLCVYLCDRPFSRLRTQTSHKFETGVIKSSGT